MVQLNLLDDNISTFIGCKDNTDVFTLLSTLSIKPQQYLTKDKLLLNDMNNDNRFNGAIKEDCNGQDINNKICSLQNGEQTQFDKRLISTYNLKDI